MRLFDSGPVTLPAYKGTSTSVRSVEEDAADAKASYDQMKSEADESTQADALAKEARARRLRLIEIDE